MAIVKYAIFNQLFKAMIITIIFSIIFANMSLAEDEEAIISMDDARTNYEFLRKETIGENLLLYYKIFITLENSGNSSSDDIILEVIDDGGYPFLENYTFRPGENKTFIMENWPFEGEGTHNITISYYPTNISKATTYNTGEKILYLYENNQQSNNSTPGFEVFLLFFVALCFVFAKRKK